MSRLHLESGHQSVSYFFSYGLLLFSLTMDRNQFIYSVTAARLNWVTRSSARTTRDEESVQEERRVCVHGESY